MRRTRPPRPYQDWFTPAFERYIRPAQAYPALWRTVLAMLVGCVIYVVGAVAVLYVLARWAFGLFDPETGTSLHAHVTALQDVVIPLMGRGDSPAAMAMMLSTFIPLGLAVWVMARLHRRGLRSLLGPRAGFIRGFAGAFLVVALFHLPFILYGSVTGMRGYTLNLPVATWVAGMLWALPLIAVQTSSEELFFRGYLQQQLAVRARNPVVWMLLPSLVFGLGHADPQAPLQLQAEYVVWATLFGLIAADLTRVTGSLAAALGMHFANNAFVMLWVGTDDAFGGLALYRLPREAVGPPPPFWVELLVLLLIWVLARRVLAPQRRR